MKGINIFDIKGFLDQKVEQYNTPGFITNDPVSIPHSFTRKQDMEIMGFFAAIFAWGQRKTIISKCRELSGRMDDDPYAFVTGHTDADLKKLLGFKHRTFNDTDLLYCVDFMKRHYSRHDTLEEAFFPEKEMDIESALNHFQSYFFSYPDAPHRTRKHIPSPTQKSACKRLNMYLRWMVRDDDKGVDFGIWKKIKPAQLICPLDLHVERTARKIGLLERDKPDWKAAIELTENLRLLDANDPAKYDFALFGISIEEKCIIP
ncbi:TIGR02757 family protein [Dysgonomonas sp. 521]|uniref:TIGR02757 family protein n=1 Tax=Dysgonomonas sp. 521 TaxID=2302932 RepID=UPI0013D83F7D|nr:TIGR02757 family protein [Dysgonomonas sp. 521]NDV95799.1 TIGR02757 family protein [Dysgonomonas sp. 521]